MSKAGQIAGIIRDKKTHAPIAGVCVAAFHGQSGAQAELYGSPCTDATGEFTLGGLLSGSYTVQAIPYDGVHVTTWLYGAYSQSTATLLNVVQGTVTTTTPVNIAVGGTITGLVTDRTTHAPIENVCVGIGVFSFRVGEDDSGHMRACTDATGRYTLTGVPAGPQHLEFIDSSGQHGLSWLGGTNRTSSRTVGVTLGRTSTANQTLAKAATVTGSFKDSAKQPVTTWLVDLFDPVTGDPVSAGEPDATGRWQASGLPAGGVKIEVEDVHSPATQWWKGQTSLATATVVTTNAGKTHSGIGFVVAP